MTGAALRRAAIKERARRARANRLSPPAVKVAEACHRKQAKLVDSLVLGKRRNICVLCGRQSGKSHGGALAALLVARGTAGINVIFVTATDSSCEKMAFLPAVEMNRVYSLGGDAHYSKGDLSISFPNGSHVYFQGANNERTINRLRGTPNLALCIIDEAGIYDTETLQNMIRAVRPGLRPRAGKLAVMGTPSKSGKQGTWYDITENPEYEQHRFDYRDNDKVPSFADVEALIDEDLRAEFPDLTIEQRRLTAYYLREYLARFEVDLSEKVYKLTNANLVDVIPQDCATHCSAGDIGVSAADTILSLGWNDDGQPPWVVDQEEERGQDTLEYARMIKAHNAKRSPLTIAVDPGGLGQKTIKTVKNMYPGIPITEAVKGPIALQVRATNEMLQRGLKIKRGSKLALELATPTWVDGKVGGEIDEHGTHSDLVPTLRYACIAARAFLPDAPPVMTEEERKRELYLEGVRRAERNARAAKRGDQPYDPGEFTELTDDLFQDKLD